MPGLTDRLRGWFRRKRPALAQRVYAAAAVSRLTGDWYAQILSADQELKGDLRRLRGASRSLVRDDPYASRFVNLLAENVIGTGPTGIKLQARNITTRGTPAKALNAQIESEWTEWCNPENASADGCDSWADIQDLLVRNLPADGEILIRLIRGAENPYGFAVQVLDPDLLDETYDIPDARRSPTGNEIRMGVEVNEFGKPVAYWLWTAHPSDFRAARRERVRVPADEIIHGFIRLRPGQTRGVPWFAPVLIRHKMLGAYEEAEINAARVGASNMAAVEYDPDKAGGGTVDGLAVWVGLYIVFHLWYPLKKK